jgi:CDP-6-deoxy-D-xylo-4-hexulose-3-dehydrase
MDDYSYLKQIALEKVQDFLEKQFEEKRQWTPGDDYVKYAGPFFGNMEIKEAISALLDGWLVMGDKCLKFEKKFPKHLGKNHGILTNSGSSANLLMIAALSSKKTQNYKKGTKILVAAGGFPTTLNPILQYGFTPIFVDIELDTLNPDLDQVEMALKNNPDTKAFMFAHALGNPPDMNRVMDVVNKYSLDLLEDCCDALGSTYDGQKLGSFGLMSSCSFYPAHHITMGEGGFVACNNKEMEDVLRSFREWGRGCYCNGPKANTLKCGTCKKRFSNWIPSFPNEIFDHKYVYDEIGYNLKPLELQGAMGLIQMEKIPLITVMRRKNYKLMYDIYSKYSDYFILPEATKNSKPSWFAFPLTIKKNAGFTRSEFLNYLEDHKIQTRPYFAGNILLQPGYDHLMPAKEALEKFPNASYSMLNTFFHGTSPVITKEQIEYIGKVVDKFFESKR